MVVTAYDHCLCF